MRSILRDLTGLVPDVAGRLPDLRDLPFRRQRGLSATGVAGMGLIAAGLGAALMFMFDPEAGRRRRARARDRVTSFVRRSSVAMDGASRDMANRARGLVIEMRSRLVPPPAGTAGTARAGEPFGERGSGSLHQGRTQP
ncbi:MAG TPA: hypothetical protein VLF19_08860 [Methylomirabilota bacterium]|nr:hypothetical protein [Methylomirabilota bacterium]